MGMLEKCRIKNNNEINNNYVNSLTFRHTDWGEKSTCGCYERDFLASFVCFEGYAIVRHILNQLSEWKMIVTYMKFACPVPI